MEELLGVIASNINMQGQDGKTFRTEAAKTLLALTQDASQVDALVDGGGAQAHAVATALARTREARARRPRRAGERIGASERQGRAARRRAGRRARDAETVDAACVVAASDAFDPQSRENALAFLQNATVRPAGAAAVAAREEAVKALLKRSRGAAPPRPRRPGPTPSRRAPRTCRRRRRFELYCCDRRRASCQRSFRYCWMVMWRRTAPPPRETAGRSGSVTALLPRRQCTWRVVGRLLRAAVHIIRPRGRVRILLD